MNSADHTMQFPPTETWIDNPRLTSGNNSPLLPRERGTPQPLQGVSGSAQSRIIGGAKYTHITLNHQAPSNDNTFHHANVWATNYLGNPNPQLVSGSTSQSHAILLPATGETVSFTVQPVGKDGSLVPLSQCPTTSQTLR